MIDITNLSTFKLHAFAKNAIEINNISELDLFFLNPENKNTPFYIVGGGSNTIFTKDFDGTILINKIKGIEQESEDINSVTFKVGSGENWDEFVHFALKNNLGGIENLISIPGTVGSSPVQNIGAYGSEVKDTIQWVEVYNIEDGTITRLLNLDCKFGYRDSIFKNELKDKVFIASVGFKLNKNPVANTTFNAVSEAFKNYEGVPSIQEVAEVIAKIRESKLPDWRTTPNCGSFFKNPIVPMSSLENLKIAYPDIPFFLVNTENVKIPAAWLIDQSGMKNVISGNVGTHPTQPLVIVNYGAQTKPEELMNFVNLIQSKVQEKFGILLEPEVNLI